MPDIKLEGSNTRSIFRSTRRSNGYLKQTAITSGSRAAADVEFPAYLGSIESVVQAINLFNHPREQIIVLVQQHPAQRPQPASAFKWGILIGIAVLIGLWFMSVNNNLVGLQEGVKKQQGQVEKCLAASFDLIPNLVNTVKGYAEHEKDTFEEIAGSAANGRGENV